jgi:hypothetical protein
MRLKIWPHPPLAAALGLAAALTIALGSVACSLPKRYYPVSEESIRDLPVLDRYVKRIGIAPFVDLSGSANSDLVRSFEHALNAALGRNCGKAQIIASTAAEAPAFLKQGQRMEKDPADTYALAQTARRAGFQVIVRGRLLSLNHRVDRSGWSKYRKSHHFLDLRLQAEAINTVTAAKIIQHSELITLPIDETTGATIDDGDRFNLPELVEKINAVGVDMALKLCGGIRPHPWQTIVKAVRGNEMVLAAAPAAGLAPGDRLAVFEGGRTITDNDGERFVLAGFRQGTVAVTRIAGEEIMAADEEGGIFPTGSILVPVR